MTAPNNTINDSQVAYGSRQLIDSTNSVTYETDDFECTPDVVRFLRTNGKGIGTGRVSFVRQYTGSCTISYPSSAVYQPQFGDAFSTSIDLFGTAASIMCTIDDVGKKETKGAETKVSIKYFINFGTVVLSAN